MNTWQIDSYNKMRFEQEIELMQHALDSYRRNAPYVHNDFTRECETRIFNAAVNLGDFPLAYEWSRTNDEHRLLIRLARGFTREEHDTCKCLSDVMPGDIELPLFFNWRRIFNKETGSWVDMYKCSKCNFMTAHPNATCTQSARNLERVKARPENNGKNKIKDHEALKQ